MKRIVRILVLASAGVTGAAAGAEDFTVCQRHGGGESLSYRGGVEGFGPGEHFIRQFYRKAPEVPIIGAPSFIETVEFNGDDAAHTWNYEIEDKSKPVPPDPANDRVHVIGGHATPGTTGYIQTYWETKTATLMAYVDCNDDLRAEGDCRIDFDDAARLNGGFAEGPALALFLDADTPRDVCILGVGGLPADYSSWSLTLDGAETTLTDRCVGAATVAALLKAKSATVSLVSASEHSKGETHSIALSGADIAATLKFARYVRTLGYQPTPERAAWLAQLIADSEAAFAAAGDGMRQCEPSEPPT